jgi:hypothetical protein
LSRPRKYDSKAEGYAAQNSARRKDRADHRVQFIAVDGEGTGSGADHRYVLLGVGDRQIENPAGLGLNDIFTFLYDEYLANPDAAFAGFFLGYDFTQWLKLLPEGRARMLLTEWGIQKRVRTVSPRLGPFPVRWDGWEFDILGMKRFKLRREGSKGWMYICDAGSFYQASLMSVIDPGKWDEPVVSGEEYEILLEGKSKRDSAILDDDMRRYNRLENDILARLMSRLNEGFTAAGIRLGKDQWFGPGQAAQKWLSATALPTAAELSDVPGMPREEGRLSYYGGWFEIFAHGHIPGTAYEYDINSAYPHIAASLPCLLHGKWKNGVGIPGRLGSATLRIVYAHVRGSDRHLGAMLHRTPEGSIRRPSATGGYYWQSELDAARRCGAVSHVDYIRWWEYEPCDCPPPLRGLVTLYKWRLMVGKNTPEGKSCKLIYNSVYGKLAQSVGDPKYGNAIYASLITSGCRTMILDAIASHPSGTDALLMVATDGVYFTEPHPYLPISENIGDWDATEKENLTLFKPGVYWDDRARASIESGRSPAFKARGIDARVFSLHIRYIDDHFSRWGDDYPDERDPDRCREGWFPRVVIHSGFSMTTCQQALQWHKWARAGTLGHEPNEGCQGCDGAHLIQDADPILKRHSGWKANGVYWSRPYPDGGETFESTPYDKMFGQPDPEEYGITDDGTVLDHWKGAYYG